MFGIGKILEFVFENGRVLADAEGNADPDSAVAEVEFEAAERGLEFGQEDAEWVRDHIK
jgi:hypothetical protein